MELLTIAHGAAVVELDELDCLRLAQACRAAQRAAMGDTNPHEFIFPAGADHYAPDLALLFATMATTFTAAAMAADASGHDVDGDTFDLARTRRTWLPVVEEREGERAEEAAPACAEKGA